MREYITKEQALRRFADFGREIPKDFVFEVIASLQEEIVRCKDCKHYKYTEGFKHGRYEAGYGCELGLRRVTADDFCSYGERSEDK